MIIDQRKRQAQCTEFWKVAFKLWGSATPRVFPNVLIFGGIAGLIQVIHEFNPSLQIELGPLEATGAVLGLLLVLRTNSGYDRWWEARKLWGGIVNQSRNLAISGLTFGPDDPKWRDRFCRFVATFPYVIRSSLRRERNLPEVERILGREISNGIVESQHMPSALAKELACMLKIACSTFQMDRFFFLQIDRERALLIDHTGACERILNTPIPLVYDIKIRRFIVLYLLVLPFGLASSLGWLTPIVQMFVAYPILALDQIGVELQNPFSKENLSHLPLDTICKTIESNVMALNQPSKTEMI